MPITMHHVASVYQAVLKPVHQRQLLPSNWYHQWWQTGEMTMESVTPAAGHLKQVTCLYLDEPPDYSHIQVHTKQHISFICNCNPNINS